MDKHIMSIRQYGYFDPDSREYVITDPQTPTPWINYLFGNKLSAFVSQGAGGMLWYEQPYYGRLTRYRFNGLPLDSPGFYLYIHDGKEWWNPSFFPTMMPLDSYECRHAPGRTTFIAEKNSIRCQMTLFITPDDVMIWKMTISNLSSQPRKVKLRPYVEFSLLEERKDIGSFLVCGNQATYKFDPQLNGIKYDYFAFESRFMGKTIFASSEPLTGFELNRDIFIGQGRTEANPVALDRDLLSVEMPDGGPYACGALENSLELAPNKSSEINFFLTTADTFEQTEQLIKRYHTKTNISSALNQIEQDWTKSLNTAQVNTGDAKFDVLLNTWFPCNIKTTMRASRSISTRHTGQRAGIRYRDTMQDLMPAAQLFPDEFERLIIKTFHAMFKNGRTVTNIDPKTLVGSRVDHLRIDGALWGVMTTYRYLAETGDIDFLNRTVPYYDDGEGSILDHLINGMKFIGANTGNNGLPLLFDTDWNDMLQIFSQNTTGTESIMVGQQYIYVARLLIEILQHIGVTDFIPYLEEKIDSFTKVLNSDVCWNGKYFKRLLFTEPAMQNSFNAERIFLNTQSWAVIAGTLDSEKVKIAMESVNERLWTRYGGRVFAPPFTAMPNSNAPFNCNVPGAGENGGIFLHANSWLIMAETLLGNRERAYEYYSAILPTHRAEENPDLYANEPYAFSSWLYGPDHTKFGAAQLSWLTGGAAWMYTVGMEYLLGVKPTLDKLEIRPCLPAKLADVNISRRWRGNEYNIQISRQNRQKNPYKIEVNKKPV
jgi:cellobiose phosphorylase